MNKNSGIKWLGIFASVAGIGLTLLNGFVSEKKQDALSEEKVQQAVAKLNGKGEKGEEISLRVLFSFYGLDECRKSHIAA